MQNAPLMWSASTVTRVRFFQAGLRLTANQVFRAGFRVPYKFRDPQRERERESERGRERERERGEGGECLCA